MATTDPFNTFGGSATPGATSFSTTPTTAATTIPWKSYNQYFAGNPEAQKWGHYQTNLVAGTPEAENFNSVWNRQTQNNPQNIPNPWQFGQEYNKYTSTLPQEYQTLIGSGISPESVASGGITGVLQGNEIKSIPRPGGGTYGTGSGSTNSLSPDILSKMWR